MSKAIAWLKNCGSNSIFWMTYSVAFSMYTAVLAVYDFYTAQWGWFITQTILCILFLIIFIFECRRWAERLRVCH
jgi:hypothetical protein